MGFGLLSPSGSERHHLFWIWGDDAGRKSRILYQQLDRDFPGMKEKYQQAFGDRYVCDSPNQQKLMAIFVHSAKPIKSFIDQKKSLPISIVLKTSS